MIIRNEIKRTEMCICNKRQQTARYTSYRQTILRAQENYKFY